MKLFGLSFKVIRTLLTTQYAYMLEYRIEIALWALSGVLPFIMFSLWSQNDVGNTFGLNDIGLARYFLNCSLAHGFFNSTFTSLEGDNELARESRSPS